jgi:hypothetical protein
MFSLNDYSPEVQQILALDGSGQRLMPLAHGVCSSEEARRKLAASNAQILFPTARSVQAALSGLYLYFSCLDESHTLSQEIHTPEGSFWHGIMHRQEPDAGNAGYWFRRVGAHPIFPALAEAAKPFGTKGSWDPFRFIELCEAARRKPGSALERQALELQRIEWQLLFAFCALAPMP